MGQHDESLALPAWGARLGLFFLLFASPLFFAPFCRDSFLIPKFLPIALGALTLWISLIKCELTEDGGVYKPQDMDGAISLFSAAMLASCAVSIDLPTSIFGPHQGQFHALVPYLLCVLIYYGVACANDLFPTDVSKMILLAAIPVSLYAILQKTGHDPLIAWSIQDGRAGSTFGSPIFLGGFLAAVVPIAWHWVLKRRTDALIGGAALILTCAALFAARSRGGALAGLGGIMLYAILIYDLPWEISGLLLLALGGVVGLHPASDVCRVEIYKSAVAIWRAHPWLGTGPDTFGLAFQGAMTDRFVQATGNTFTIQLSAHNDLLQVLSTMGIIGLLAYLIFLYKAWQLARVAAQRSDEAKAIVASMFAIWIQAKFNPVHISVLAIGAVMLGSISALPIIAEPEKKLKLGAAAVCALVLVYVSGCLGVAEWYQHRGDVLREQKHYVSSAEMFNRAAHVDPWDVWYSQKQLDALWLAAPFLEPGSLGQVAWLSVQTAGRACRLHPHDPTAHEMLAIALHYKGLATGKSTLAESDEELSIAHALFPKAVFYLTKRAEIAQAIKDFPAYERFSSEIERLNGLTRKF